MDDGNWKPISTAPTDADLELAVVEVGKAHPLVFRCRRHGHAWINSETSRPVDVSPTHWREWPAKR
jgi:hypothetical protein